MSTNQFKLQINFTKAYAAEGDEGNFAYIEGIASGPEVDLTGERMSIDALKSMVESFKNGIIEFRDAHKTEWNDDLGELVDLHLTDDNHLFYKSRIDLNLSGSKDLLYRINTLGKKYGVSIGGSVVKAGYEYVAELGRQIFTYVDVALEEISITRQAAYQHSFADVVTKSLSPKEAPMNKSAAAQVEKTDVETTETEITQETVAAEEQSDATETQAEQTETEATTEEAAEQSDATTEEAQVETEADVEKSTAADVDAQTDEFAKSAILGAYAEADVVYDSISTLSWNLKWFVWDVIADGDKTKDEKNASIASALAEFSRIIQTVASSLTETAPDAEMVKSMEAERANTPDAVSKSFADTATQVEQLTKSLETKTAEAETATKSLTEMTEELTKAKAELDKIEARKTLALNDGARQAVIVDDQVEKSTKPESVGDLYMQSIGAK